MRALDALKVITQAYKDAGLESSLLEAELLLMDLLSCNRSDLHFKDLIMTEKQFERAQALVVRRKNGEPLAYLLGYQDFYRSRFIVNANVLIPRPETELIIEIAKEIGPFVNIAELGVGSGCIGLSLLKEFPNSRFWGCDLSPGAVAVAKQNCDKLDLAERAQIHEGDVGSFLISDQFDLVVSNPPYIDITDPRLEKNVKKFEPHQALFAGNNGLQFYNEWIPWSYKALKLSGWAAFEVGEGQAEPVKKIFRDCGFTHVNSRKDLSAIDRVVFAQKEI